MKLICFEMSLETEVKPACITRM